MIWYDFFDTLCLQIRIVRKGNCEDAIERFPTNGIKYETKNLNNFRESLNSAELQKEVKRLRELIAKVSNSL